MWKNGILRTDSGEDRTGVRSSGPVTSVDETSFGIKIDLFSIPESMATCTDTPSDLSWQIFFIT